MAPGRIFQRPHHRRPHRQHRPARRPGALRGRGGVDGGLVRVRPHPGGRGAFFVGRAGGGGGRGGPRRGQPRLGGRGGGGARGGGGGGGGGPRPPAPRPSRGRAR